MVHIHIHTHIYTYIHTHTHTHSCVIGIDSQLMAKLIDALLQLLQM